MLGPMLISLGLPTDRLPRSPSLASAGAIARISQRAEAAGYHAVFVTDHPFPPGRWLASGGHHSLDPFVALSFAGSATTTLKLQTNLLVLGYRNPFMTAHSIASLDSLSGGRTIIGVGAGYLEAEFDAVGAEFIDRGRLCDEALIAMRQAWSGEAVEFEGSRFRATGNVLQPLPAQQPHPPLIVGGNSTAAIRRAVTLADGWVPMPSPASAARRLRTPGIETIDHLSARLAIAHEIAAEVGRVAPLQVWFTPWGLSGFGTGAWDPRRLRDSLDALADVGVHGVTITLPGTTEPEFTAALDSFAAAIAG
jgi:probable F420-dependent oxidoreductase